jgi:hypothetical protein
VGEAVRILVDTYLMARKFMLEKLQNHNLDTIRNVTSLMDISPRNVVMMHDGLPPEDGLMILPKQHLAEQLVSVG